MGVHVQPTRRSGAAVEPHPASTRVDAAFDDGALMREVAARDADALAVLYDRHAPRVLGLCMRVLRDRAEAEEVLEDVFWELWQRAERYDAERGDPLSYLLVLTRSRALDRLRAVRRRAGVVHLVDRADAPEPPAAENAASPQRALLRAEQSERIGSALGELPPKQRRAIELSFFAGLSHSDIAHELGEPLGTVKTRIRQGLLSLRAHLRRTGETGPT